MRTYVAAYLDTKIEETVKALNNIPKSSKVVKIYSSPTLESLQEHIHYARAQGFEKIRFVINDMENAKDFVSELNESYGYLFRNGIGLIKLREDTDDPGQYLLDHASAEAKQAWDISKNVSLDAKHMSEQNHTMYIVNPIGIIPFKNENSVCNEILRYIRAAKEFKSRYSQYCNSVYIADFVPLNNKSATRFNSSVYLKDNINWLKSSKCTLPEEEVKELVDFFSDEIATHKSWSTQDSLVHEVGMTGNYLFGPNIFWANLTGFHINNNKNVNKYNTKVNEDIQEKVNGNRDTPIPNYLEYEQGFEGFYFGWGNGAKQNQLPSIEEIGDAFFIQFKNCCREVSVNKMVVPENTALKASNLVSYLASIISHYVVDKEFRLSVEANKNKNNNSNATSDNFESTDGSGDPDYWNRGASEDSLNKLVDKYVLNKEVDGEKWVDKTLEGWYNRDSLLKGKLGLDDGKDKYNYKSYEKKAKELGVSGYELYKLDKRKKEIDEEIDRYLKEIEGLDDSNKEEASMIKDINKEIEALKQEKKDLQVYIDRQQRSTDKNEKIYNVSQAVDQGFIEDSKDFKVTYNRCVKLLNSNYHQLVQKVIINR